MILGPRPADEGLRMLDELAAGRPPGTADLGRAALLAMIEGDRQRACRHHAELIDALPPGSDGVASSYRLLLARDLCYLGRFDEAEPVLRQAQAVPSDAVQRALGPAVEALLLAARGELKQAEALARAGVAAAETETDNLWLQGWGYEDLATVLEHAGRIDDARGSLERALVLWEWKRCLPYVRRVREQIDSLGRAKV
jgi:tetratricopeptide (TPR) repeat protein